MSRTAGKAAVALATVEAEEMPAAPG